MLLKRSLIKIIIVIATTISSLGLASTFGYLQELSGLSKLEAHEKHQRIKEKSQELSFLDCPIELIERQWQGPESVKIGIQYFQEYLLAYSNKSDQYQTISDRCSKTLLEYKINDIDGIVKGRAISYQEKEELKSELLKQSPLVDKNFIEILVSYLNESTVCQSNRIALGASTMIGGSIGICHMQCFTPLGRRFKLLGPSIGLGLGAGAYVSLPNLKSKNRLSYHFQLYKRSEGQWWYSSNSSTTLAVGPGIAVESDLPHWVSDGEREKGMLHDHDLRAAGGINFSIEDIYNYMREKKLSSFYYHLIESGIFD